MRYIFICSSLLVSSLRALRIDNNSKEQPKQLVIVRSHNPHEGMIHRMQQYVADIRENMLGSRIMISVDTTQTKRDNVTENLSNVIRQSLPEAEIHIYDNSLVAAAYKSVPTSGYSWHTEPLNLAAKYAFERFGIAFDYIWMVEDDVIICGGITKLLTLHAGNSADLLGGMPGRMPSPGHVERWIHREEGTQQFLERYPVSKRRHGYEQVLRFSRNLLDRLHELAYAEGVSAQSEMFPYTVALNENFKFDNALEDNYGEFCWIRAGGNKIRCAFSRNEEIRMCKKVEQEGKVTINHAAKARMRPIM
jgi:hypothetical protein